MKTLAKFGGLFCALALMVVLTGCGGADAPTTVQVGSEAETPTAVSAKTLCGDCGHEKDTEECCAEGCETCDGCGLHKGSDLCCAVSDELKGKDMCASCGHEAGTEACCAEDCETCDHCGLHEGAPLCCKLPHGEDGHTHDHGDEAEGTDGE